MTQDIKLMEMDLEELENVSGGYIYKATFNGGFVRYEVIDDKTGEVVEHFGRTELWDAEKCAREHGLSTEIISWDDVLKLRIKGPKIGIPLPTGA